MSTKVRLKFKCINRDLDESNGIAGAYLQAVSEGSPENEAFFEATPNGTLSLGVVNPLAANAFEVGAEYYIDITRAD